MDLGKYLLSIGEVKATDIVNYLSKLGYEPEKIRNNDYWYLSPLREEKKPSFKVNRKLNRWYDHGLGKGGNIIDFGIHYHKCTVAEFLQQFRGDFSFQKPISNSSKKEARGSLKGKIIIIKERDLISFPLLNYLKQRHIPIGIANQFCKEIIYQLNNKTYYGIGFKNDSSGFEIRNPYFKASSSPKDITTIKNGAEEACVFEGFTDFLSFMAIDKNQSANKYDFVILNSVSFFEKARPFMETHKAIRLYLDRDTTGQNCSKYALSLNSKYKDESRLYAGYKDLNEWLANIGKTQKRNQRQKLS